MCEAANRRPPYARAHPLFRIVIATASWLGLHVVSACVEHDGARVSVALAPPVSPSHAADYVEVVSDLGYRVRIHRGFVAIGTVTIEKCPAGTARASMPVPSLFHVHAAYAHGTQTPTTLATPFVASLSDWAGQLVPVGTLEPPLGRYCRATIAGRIADADAVGVVPEVVGKTLWLRGEWFKDGVGTGTLAIDSKTSFDVDATYDAIDMSAGTDVRLVVAMDTSHWFDGVDLASTEPGDVARATLDGVRRSIDLRRE